MKIMNDVQKAYEQLPAWMQSPVVVKNKTQFELENGRNVRACSYQTFRGRAFSHLIMDEPAFICKELYDEAMLSGTLINPNGKILMLSTPCGHNHFQEAYIENINNPNWYVFHKSWREMGDPWQTKRSQFYSEDQWRQEYEAMFI